MLYDREMEDIRLNIIEEKVKKALTELSEDKNKQWTSIILTKPLLEQLLELVQE